MDQPTLKTSGSYSTFVSKCSELEERLIDEVDEGAHRDALVGRVRSLRKEFASWPCSPPSLQARSERWMELVGLEQHAGALKPQRGLSQR